MNQTKQTKQIIAQQKTKNKEKIKTKSKAKQKGKIQNEKAKQNNLNQVNYFLKTPLTA